MLFMVIIILVRPISSYSEISVFESSVALLAGVFMADNYGILSPLIVRPVLDGVYER